MQGRAQDCFIGVETERSKIEAEGRDRGGVIGEGQQAASPPAKGLGQRCELPQTLSWWGEDNKPSGR